jgi:hypothetical protein
MCSNTEHVIELLHTLQTIERGTDSFRRSPDRQNATCLEHMFEIWAKGGYIRPYER